MNHLLLCPALLNEHLVMKEEMKSKFSQWNIPLSSIPLHSREQKTCNRLFIATREKTLPSISDSRLHNLTKAYWKANRFKQHISTKKFLHDLHRALNNRFPNRCVYLRNDLLALLIQAFTLQTHGFTDSVNFSTLFEDWTSINRDDVPFGARGGQAGYTVVRTLSSFNLQRIILAFKDSWKCLANRCNPKPLRASYVSFQSS